ncbi:MAG: AMP-binding protein [Oligoflexia bacterium]|nr:AMP-binding protein [Oligoflexia bacterium]
MMDWLSDEIYIASNDKAVSKKIQKLADKSPHLSGHVFIKSSGTMGEAKWVCLSKKAFLASAMGVNQNLLAKPHDIWLQALPLNHVAGLAVYARSYLTGAQVIEWNSQNPKWDAKEFYNALEKNNATLTSLVPTQVFDLVMSGFKAPQKLRAVLVGGAAISENLYLKARKLGWPLLPSYGMTETCSQIASANLESLEELKFPELKLLSHAQSRVDEKKVLHIQSRSLLTSYLNAQMEETLIVSGGWFKTQDYAEIVNGAIRPLGRMNDQIKIAGELVSKSQLQQIFYELSLNSPQLNLHFTEDDRLGHRIQLLAEKNNVSKNSKASPLEDLVKKFNKKVKPYEKIREVVVIDHIPKTILGKFI